MKKRKKERNCHLSETEGEENKGNKSERKRVKMADTLKISKSKREKEKKKKKEASNHPPPCQSNNAADCPAHLALPAAMRLSPPRTCPPKAMPPVTADKSMGMHCVIGWRSVRVFPKRRTLFWRTRPVRGYRAWWCPCRQWRK